VTPPESPPAALETRIIVEKPGIGEAMLAAFAAIGFAVSARVLLFLSLIGAFVLATMAMLSQTNMSAIILSLFCVLTVVPLVALEISARKKD
jgi:hypothetical protein